VARDDSDFDEFVMARGAALLRSGYLLTGDRQLAEDLVQSSLAKTYRHWPRVRKGSPEAYVRQVMVRENITWWRRRRVLENPVEQVPDAAGVTREDIDLRLALDGALHQLTPHQRAVVVLRFYDDLTERQTADALGCSVGTVKSQAHRALARLREIVPGVDEPDSEPAMSEEVRP
jgi:RNA polymerase sigma-70 factor (sigma-E family)